MKKMRFVLCLLLCAAFVLSLAACKKGESVDTTPTAGVEKVAHTVRILNQGDMPLEKVGVYIYEDSTMAELVWYDVTNADGEMTFTDVTRDTYVAVLADVPTGYEVEEYYPLTGEMTEIRLAAGVMSEDETVTYKLGDMMMDFTVTATDGKEYTLYGLMEGKQAVILNFYYNDCVPCQMEFPYLQEAYQEYKDKVAVLALNPIDDNEAVTQFKKNHKLSFLMAACDGKWEEIMQISAYPTTVVIDRFGNIVLIHKGGIDDAQIFKDVFAAVTGNDYKQTIYKSIDDVPSTAPVDPYENPTELSATEKFEVTLEGGKEHTIQFYRLNKLIMTLKDPDAYIIYNNKKYTPKNGVITLIVSTPDMNTPVDITFGNSSNQLKKFTVTMMAQKGSMDNPYQLVIGENQVKISAGNEQGVYYVWTAPDNGTLRMWCISATAGVSYDCSLLNTVSMAMRNLSEDGVAENGTNVVSVQVNKGDMVQIIASVLPDAQWNYPAGNFTYMAEFVSGEGREDTKVETTDYTVTVTDADGNPMPNVNFHTLVEEKATPFSTESDGVAVISLPSGTYKVTMIVPEGYTSEVTEFTLTADAPSYTIKLTPKVKVMVDYTVSVVAPAGEPVANATVIVGEKFALTGADGKAVFQLEEGQYTGSVIAPTGYLAPEENTFALGEKTAITVTLGYVPGTVNAPIDVETYPYTTEKLAPAKPVYYKLHNAGGMVLTVKDATLIIGEDTYQPDADGNVVVTLPAGSEPVAVQLVNNGEAAKSAKLSLSYTVGHATNPQPLEALGEIETVLNPGDEQYYHYSWKTAEEGVVTFYVVSATEGVTYDVILTNLTNGKVSKLSTDADAGLVSLNVAAGDDVSIQVTVTDFGAVTEAATVVSTGSFTAQELTDVAKQTYSVIVQDQEGNAMPGVSVTIGNTNLTTDANGLAFAQLMEGTYTTTVLMPEGFKTETAQFVLTVDAPQKIVILLPVVMVDYTVNVTKDSAAYTGNVTVQIFKGQEKVHEAATTTGQIVANLPEGDYTVQLVLADTMVEYNPENCNLSTAAPTLNIPLSDVILYADYTVKVVNASNQVQSGILVQIQKGDVTVENGTATTNSNGTATFYLPQDQYNVVLSFGGTQFYYNKNTATLTANNPQTEIMLANEVSGKTATSWGINGAKMYVLQEGYTHVQVSDGQAYYRAEDNACMFKYVPTQIGVFRIGVDNPNVDVIFYASEHYLGIVSRSSSNEDNACYFEITDSSQIGNQTQLMGIEVVPGVTDVGITITRVGDPGFNVSRVPWTTDWQKGATPTKKITLNSGLRLKYIDVTAPANTYNIVYSATDGYYHVGSATGPVLYVNLGKVDSTSIPYALNKIIHGDGSLGGSAIKKYFYDANGLFVKKEDYTELIDAYITYSDDTYGLHPVTKDMEYMLKNGTDKWWDPNAKDYDAEFAIANCTVELGWMFACCYIG